MKLTSVDGNQTLLTSPRNSIRAQENLFAFAKCKILVTTSPKPAQLQPMITALSFMEIQVLELPDILELTEKSHEHFPFEKTFAAARNEPFAVMHTSGTTELPKPIFWNHNYYATSILLPEPPAGYINQASLYAVYKCIQVYRLMILSYLLFRVRVFNTFTSFHSQARIRRSKFILI